jgi:signal transduction histidine kinase
MCIRVRSYLPIIFLTAIKDNESIDKGFEVGGVDYITKPFNRNELIRRVQTHIQLKRHHDELEELNTLLDLKVKERTTELFESNKQLTLANKELSQLDIAKTNVICILSNEIRVPLNNISNVSGLLRIRNVGAFDNKLLSSLDENVKKLELFSNRTLLISKLNNLNSDHLIISKIDINDILFNVVNSQSQLTLENGLFIEYSGIDDFKGDLYGDAKLIHVCLEEIFKNAITYSPTNSTIRIDFQVKNKLFEITISDEGKSFTPIELKNMFIPFLTGDDDIPKTPHLGLYLSKLIIDAHKGEILAENNLNHGVIIKIKLPYSE